MTFFRTNFGLNTVLGQLASKRVIIENWRKESRGREKKQKVEEGKEKGGGERRKRRGREEEEKRERGEFQKRDE
jgi:hypothetical protein